MDTMKSNWFFDGKIIYVHAGDSVDVVLDIGFGITVKRRMKVDGIDLPSLRSSNRQERKIAQEVKAFMMENFLNKKCLIETFKNVGGHEYAGNIFIADEKAEEKFTTIVGTEVLLDVVKVTRDVYNRIWDESGENSRPISQEKV